MAGRRRDRLLTITCDEMGSEIIKKGPWKAEEDEVLRNHVRKYGPREWSSIRSKGLLQRTGKSCRLRWVNKLRPNLKNGVKFSGEEERIVIDLQAQFGNKWAKIATYLPGRTDNDVKNFWSSRQKKLARILQTPASSSSSNRSHRNKQGPAVHIVPPFEAPKFSSSSEEDSIPKCQSCSSSYTVKSPTVELVPLPEQMYSSTLNCDQSFIPLELDLIERKPSIEALSQLPFPQFPNFPSEFTLPLENTEAVTRLGLGDPNYFEALGSSNPSDLGDVQLPALSTCFESERRSAPVAGRGDIGNPVTPDSFVDDFPMDIFDHIEPLPSPLNW